MSKGTRRKLLSKVEAKMVSAFGSSSETLGRAALHHLEGGGSRVRARLAVDAGVALSLDETTITAIAASSELVHNASLIHDDIQDGEQLRRGRPAVWTKFGMDVAICVGDAMLSNAATMLALTRAPVLPELLLTFNRCVLETIHGQCQDLEVVSNAGLSFSGYSRIATAKSAPLLALPLELSLITAARDDWLMLAREAATNFALAYQISDDIEDQLRDAAQGSPNAVAVLQNVDGVVDPVAMAIRVADEAWAAAACQASALPDGAGETMAEMARRRLSSALERVA
ncbi:hypothetical protein BST95_01470 [Halioglobus japonicus]|uniref:Polyprenyl synthetase n=2 Tax=Halioglobus japonicus TaxID=930805 RepID=A0AAP8SLZ1_9GAMM|nr:hypothetical protein BST95_01470 [Halioglobus japonicus]PLW84989.1 polyprenyl synthetase [Halioglobus japonicus]GHD18881.1 hypothetical protein GCM10007052_26700 [Halioglobus japonicus]